MDRKRLPNNSFRFNSLFLASTVSEPKKYSILDELLADVPADVNVFVQLIGDLAEQVKADMLAQGLTRRALAQRLGKSESEITKWLSGLHNLTLNSVAKLSAALQVDLLVTRNQPQGYFGRQVAGTVSFSLGPAEVSAVQPLQPRSRANSLAINAVTESILRYLDPANQPDQPEVEAYRLPTAA